MSVPVLIVDDEPFIRVLLEQSLEDLGDRIQIFQASDGQQGLEMALQLRPKILILDIMMPRLSGLELCGKLRANEAFKDAVIILLTARGNDLDAKEEAISSGATHYMVKPFDPDAILELVGQYC